jgi:hypothetical protein
VVGAIVGELDAGAVKHVGDTVQRAPDGIGGMRLVPNVIDAVAARRGAVQKASD